MKPTELQLAIDCAYDHMNRSKQYSKEYEDAYTHLKILRSVQAAMALEGAELALDDIEQYHQRTK